jgi:O-6-methylguanine DNA methyltransferase
MTTMPSLKATIARQTIRKDRGAAFQAWAKGRRLVETTIPTPLGDLVAVADDAGLRIAAFSDLPELKKWKAEAQATLGAVIAPGTHPHLTTLKRELAAYFSGKGTRFTIPLVPLGTPFRQAVWERLVIIPFGKATTYGELAGATGKPGASRAVGGAVGANPLIIVIPCHRVLGAGGVLGGFSAGIERKKWLLAHEGAGKFALKG